MTSRGHLPYPFSDWLNDLIAFWKCRRATHRYLRRTQTRRGES